MDVNDAVVLRSVRGGWLGGGGGQMLLKHTHPIRCQGTGVAVDLITDPELWRRSSPCCEGLRTSSHPSRGPGARKPGTAGPCPTNYRAKHPPSSPSPIGGALRSLPLLNQHPTHHKYELYIISTKYELANLPTVSTLSL